MKTILLLVEAFTAVFFVGLALPLLLRKVPPNSWYGVRVKKTLTNESLWYEANAFFGKDFLIASLTVLLACVVFFLIKDTMALNTFLLVVSIALVIPYFVPVIRTLVYLRRL